MSYIFSKEEIQQMRKDTGVRLKFERMKLGLSQEELAFELGISDRQYRRYEAGECQFPSNMASKLKEMNEVNMDFLYVGRILQDTYLHVGMKSIPYDSLVGIYQICQKALGNGEAIIEIEPILATMRELVVYGEKNMDSEFAKEPPEFPFYMEIYIMSGLEQIKSHGLKWEGEIPTQYKRIDIQ